MSSKVKYKGGRYCCVKDCHSRQGRDDVRFFSFPKKNKEQFEKWTIRVKRENFVPNAFTVICGHHFVKGKPDVSPDSPDFAPSIFPTLHCKAKKVSDLQRYNRAAKRNLESITNLSEIVLNDFKIQIYDIP